MHETNSFETKSEISKTNARPGALKHDQTFAGSMDFKFGGEDATTNLESNYKNSQPNVSITTPALSPLPKENNGSMFEISNKLSKENLTSVIKQSERSPNPKY